LVKELQHDPLIVTGSMSTLGQHAIKRQDILSAYLLKIRDRNPENAARLQHTKTFAHKELGIGSPQVLQNVRMINNLTTHVRQWNACRKVMSYDTRSGSDEVNVYPVRTNLTPTS
jgi:hypothetical protein